MIRTSLALVAILLLAAVLSACGRSEGDRPAAATQAAGKPLLVASIYPLSSLLDELTGEWATVQCLLPPGLSPHGLEMTPAQVRAVGQAQLVLLVGLNLDNWAQHAVDAAGKRAPPVIRAGDLLDRQDLFPEQAATTAPADPHDQGDHHDDEDDSHHHGGVDPHVWLDPVLMAKILQRLTPLLQQQFPEHAQAIGQRSGELSAQLVELDQEYRSQLALVPNKKLITFHNAFDRPARRYGLEVVVHLTDVELSGGGEVTPQRWIHAQQAVKEHHLGAIYAEPQMPAQATASLARTAGVQVLQLDPQGHPQAQGYQGYFAMMRSNLATMVRGQSLPPAAGSR